MPIRDYYQLESSHIFQISPYEQKKIDLELKKADPVYHTLLFGAIRSCHKPIKNATIEILDLNSNPLFKTISNEDGKYRFKNILSPGEYKMIATAKHYITSNTQHIAIKENCKLKVNFFLKKNPMIYKGMLYGTIKDSTTNETVSNAKILLINTVFNDIVSVTYSNDKGQYLIYNIPPNDDYMLIVKHENYLKLKSTLIDIQPNDNIPLNLFMTKNTKQMKGTLNGSITDGQIALKNTPVFLCASDQHDNFIVNDFQFTNKKGEYLFSDIQPDNYTIKSKLQEDNLTDL